MMNEDKEFVNPPSSFSIHFSTKPTKPTNNALTLFIKVVRQLYDFVHQFQFIICSSTFPIFTTFSIAFSQHFHCISINLFIIYLCTIRGNLDWIGKELGPTSIYQLLFVFDKWRLDIGPFWLETSGFIFLFLIKV